MSKFVRRLCFVLSLALVIAALVASRGPFPAASDGSGPNGDALIAFFILVAASVMVAFTALLSLLTFSNAREAKITLVLCAALGLTLYAPQIYDTAHDKARDIKYKSSAYYKMNIAIEKGTLAEFNEQLAKIPDVEKTPSFEEDVFLKAVHNARIDILQELKKNHLAIPDKSDHAEWITAVQTAVSSFDIDTSEHRLKTVEWLFKHVAPRFSLQTHAGSFFRSPAFQTTFDKIDDPNIVKLFELLVKHGADVNVCEEACPLWYAARMKRLDQVQFLVAHGANVKHIEKESGTTARDEALSNHDDATAAFLEPYTK